MSIMIFIISGVIVFAIINSIKTFIDNENSKLYQSKLM